jgi:mRNA interferase HigB
VNVVSKRTLKAFYQKHPQAKKPLLNWYRVFRTNRFESLETVRELFPHADLAQSHDKRSLTVFNIGGNEFRLVVVIVYLRQTVFIKKILTHAEYDEWNKEKRI